jgi:hypothetical protein
MAKFSLLMAMVHISFITFGQSEDVMEVLFPPEVIKQNGIRQIIVTYLMFEPENDSKMTLTLKKTISKDYFDRKGNLLGISHSSNEKKKSAFKNIYDKNGFLILSIQKTGKLKDSIPDTTFYSYDEMGRVFRISHNEDFGKWIRERKYDEQSRLIEKIGYFINAEGNIDSTKTVKRKYYYNKSESVHYVENYSSDEFFVDKKLFCRGIENEVILIIEEKQFLINGISKKSMKYSHVEYSDKGVPKKCTEFIESSSGMPMAFFVYKTK